jgi:TIR domain-containing protein
MSYKIFVSYSWSNAAERRALEAELGKLQNASLLVDRQFIKPGDKIHERIDQMIDAADCVIVLLTPQGLASPEVRDELSRSHDRGKRIVPVVADGTTLQDLPWYLRDTHYINYREREFDRVVEDVVRTIDNFTNPMNEFVGYSFPVSIEMLLKSGSRFLSVPSHDPARYPYSEYIFCALAMRQSETVVVFAAHPKYTVETVASALAEDLLPHLDRFDYEWELVKNSKRLASYLTLESAGVRSGEELLLLGNHRMPEWAPRLA